MKKIKAVLPQNYRGIPAKTQEHVRKFKTRYIVSLIILESVCLVILCVALGRIILQYKTASEKRLMEMKELSAWEKLITKYPNYAEAYYGAAIHAEAVGDLEKAGEYVNKSLQLNPNFEASKKLREQLGK